MSNGDDDDDEFLPRRHEDTKDGGETTGIATEVTENTEDTEDDLGEQSECRRLQQGDEGIFCLLTPVF